MSTPMTVWRSERSISIPWSNMAHALAALILVLVLAACSSTEEAYLAVRGDEPCLPGAALDAQSERCDTGRNVLMAMATGQRIDPHEFVEQEVLENQRGGFLSVGGLRVDFGFEFHTVVNGTPQLTSVLSYSDIISGNGMIPKLNTVTVAGPGGGTTDIIHTFGSGGISALVLNSEDGVRIDNVSTLAIDVIGLGRVHRGSRALGKGGAMPMEMQQSIVRSLQ